jgi:hypothetical protein
LCTIICKPSIWHNLPYHQVQDILDDFKVFSKDANKLAAIGGFDFAITEHFGQAH